jgi:hypothetical protein
VFFDVFISAPICFPVQYPMQWFIKGFSPLVEYCDETVWFGRSFKLLIARSFSPGMTHEPYGFS